LADLRRGAGKPPGTEPRTFRYVVPWASGQGAQAERRLYLVASLFALHSSGAAEGNLGTTFRQIAARGESESTEKRFVALLNCNVEDLPNHLRHAVSLAKSREVPINWRQLLADLRHFDHEDRYVQRQWAGAFWQHQSSATAETESDTHS
ncbi:MAG TPA: type I-E CRISPR-associated protein Cse2/CasB, partial [Armatimonadota bacterium]|nr:type I-E CRISPR-associated protein Cse2/CasB [Armatimonadota bacterium]